MLPRLLLALCCPLLFSALQAEPVLLAKQEAKILPEQIFPIHYNEAGILSDWADSSQQLEKGQVIAIFNKERSAQEREDLELQIEKDKLLAEDELRKLEENRQKLRFYADLSPEERKYAEKPDRDLTGYSPQAALRDLDKRESLLRRELEVKERKQRRDFELSHEKLCLRMPFRGRLQYNINLPQTGQRSMEYAPIPGSAGFATACDDSAFYICVNLPQAELAQLPGERFSAVLRLPEGELRGRFSHKRVETANRSDMIVYYFRLPEKDNDTAYKLLGSQCKAELFYECDGQSLHLPKAELAARPEAAQCDSWEELTQLLYPQYRLIYCSERELILSPAPIP